MIGQASVHEKCGRASVHRRKRTRATARRAAVAAAVGAVLLCVAPARGADRSADADRAGSGESYWGPLPAPADTVTARIEPRPRPAWEWPGYVVYRTVGYPLHLAKLGFRSVVVETAQLGYLKRLLPPYGPYRLGITAYTDGSGDYALGGSASAEGPFGNARVAWDWSTQHMSRGSLGWRSPGERLSAGLRYSLRGKNRFYGIGPDTGEGDKSYYTQELWWGGLAVRREVASDTDVRLVALYSDVAARGAVEEYTSLEELHAAPYGFHEHSTGVTLAVELRRDTTRELRRPQHGGIGLVRAGRFLETGSVGEDFWIFRAEGQRFLPLLRSKQTLAVRSYAEWLVADDLDAIPFQRLRTNDEPDQFRGYHDYRWRDRGIAGATVEYRWPLWAYARADDFGTDIVLFWDTGQVFRDAGDIAADRLTKSYGVGLRFVGRESYVGRLEAAWSEEGGSVRLKGDQLLQFAKSGLENGKDLIAVR